MEKYTIFQADATLQTLPGGSTTTRMTVENRRAEASDKVRSGSVCSTSQKSQPQSYAINRGQKFHSYGGKMCKINMSIAAQEVPSLRKHLKFPEKMLKLMSINNKSKT